MSQHWTHKDCLVAVVHTYPQSKYEYVELPVGSGKWEWVERDIVMSRGVILHDPEEPTYHPFFLHWEEEEGTLYPEQDTIPCVNLPTEKGIYRCTVLYNNDFPSDRDIFDDNDYDMYFKLSDTSKIEDLPIGKNEEKEAV